MHQATPQQLQQKGDLERALKQRLGSSTAYASDGEVEVSAQVTLLRVSPHQGAGRPFWWCTGKVRGDGRGPAGTNNSVLLLVVLATNGLLATNCHAAQADACT